MRARLWLLLTAALLGGCGWVNAYFVGTDNTLAPAELEPLTEPRGVTRRWQVATTSGRGGSHSVLRPAGLDGRVYVAGREGDVSALDADSGARLWRVETGTTVSAGTGLGEGLVLVGTIDGEVLALAAGDGSERWRVRASSEVLAPPVAADGVVVVRTLDGSLTGLDAADGTRLWVHDAVPPVLTLHGASTPLIARGVVIAGLDSGKLVLLELASGTLIGERRIAPPTGRTEVERMVDIDAELARAGDVLFVATYQGALMALNLASGETLWARDFSSHTGLASNGRRLFAGDTEDTVWAFDPGSGTPQWEQTALRGRRLTAPVVTEGSVVDAADGTPVARVRGDPAGFSGRPLILGPTLYALGNSGQLDAYTAVPGG